MTLQRAMCPLTVLAVITALPSFFAVTLPLLFTDATALSLLVHVSDLSEAS